MRRKIISDEFKAKVRQLGRKARELALPFFIGGTLGAAWGGYILGFKNCGDIQKVKKDVEEVAACVNQHAGAGNALISRVSTLERQNAILMEKALTVTEGKDEPAA